MMNKPRFYLQVFILIFFTIHSCKKENEPIEYYPNANRIDTILHDGIIRTYKLHVPPGYSSDSKTPLVIALHGHSSSAATGFESGSRLSEKADLECFIIAYPNGLHYPWDADSSKLWNVGGQYEEWTQGTDDVGFIDKMIDLICKYYTVDASQIYVTGHSNGARMTYRVGYELSRKIAAIAPHSGQMVYVPAKKMDSPVPVLHLHALNDNVVYYNGSTTSELHYSSADEVLGNWASYYSCSSLPVIIFTNSDYIIKEWKCPENVADIKLYLTNRGEHNWFTTSNSGISANDVIWEFLKAHPKKR
jgi:polyhydroxybutyrate depolymerase